MEDNCYFTLHNIYIKNKIQKYNRKISTRLSYIHLFINNRTAAFSHTHLYMNGQLQQKYQTL